MMMIKSVVLTLTMMGLFCAGAFGELTNGSFELPNLNNSCEHDGTLPTNWNVFYTGSTNPYYYVGAWPVSDPPYSNVKAKDGSQMVWGRGIGFWQNTGVVMVEGATYTLSTYAMSENGFYARCYIAMYGAATSDTTSLGDFLGRYEFNPPVFTVGDGWSSTPYTYSYTCDAANAGKYLQVAVYGEADDTYFFDQVSLSVAVPPPGIQNGSFEQADVDGYQNGSVPANWKVFYTGNPYPYFYLGTYPNDPPYENVMAKDGSQMIWGRGIGLWQNTRVVMVAGATYTLSAYAMSETGQYTQCDIAMYSAATSETSERGNLVGQYEFSTPVFTTGWSSAPFTYSYTCDVTNAGKYLQVAVYGWGDDTYFFDQVSLSIALPPVGIQNGSFEEPGLGGYENSRAPANWNVFYPGSVSPYFYLGSYPTDPPYQNVKAKDGSQMVWGRGTGFWQNTGIVMVEGVTYELSTYAMSENNFYARCYLGLYAATGWGTSSLGNDLGRKEFNPPIFTVGDGWLSTPYTYSYTCDAANAGKYLQVAVYGEADDTYFFDQVSLDIQTVSKPTFSPAYPVISGLKPITITSATTNATIRYTTDGTEPSESNGTEISSGGSVTINVNNTTLKAKAFADGSSSPTASTTYTVLSDYNRPSAIARKDGISVNGSLTEWAGSDFVPLDKTYDGAGATDVPEAYYAAKWSSDGNIYVAVKVRDIAHVFTSTYTGWDARDAVEVYLHTQGTTGSYETTEESAQQYIVGIKSSATDQVWTSLAGSDSAPADTGFQAAGKVDGQWLYYEMVITPFDYYGGLLSKTSTVSTLSENDVIGLDVCVVGNDGQTSTSGNTLGYTGSKSENSMSPKFKDYTKLGLHKLVVSLPPIPGDANGDGAVNVSDLSLLAANYGTTSGATWAMGDFTGDGAVNVSDLSLLAANYGTGSSSTMNWADAYAQAFGMLTSDADQTLDNTTNDTEDTTGSTICSSLGLSLIAGFILMGLMIAKLEE